MAALAWKQLLKKLKAKEMKKLKADDKEMKKLKAEDKQMKKLKADDKEMNKLKADDKEMKKLKAKDKEMIKLASAVVVTSTLSVNSEPSYKWSKVLTCKKCSLKCF